MDNVLDFELTYTLDDIVEAAVSDENWDLPEEDKGILYAMDFMFYAL